MPERETDILKPYEGPPPTPENFSQAFPHVERQLVRGGATLDSDTQQNLDELKKRMRANPPKPATVINLHPFELQLAESPWTRGIRVPACLPGQPYAYIHVRGWLFHSQYVDGTNGVRKFTEVRPIERVKAFIQTFSQKDTFGESGVIIFEGDSHPDKAGDVETYDSQGTLITVESKSWEFNDDTGERTPVIVPIPVKKKLSELIAAATKARNQHYFKKVQEADQDYRLPDGKGKKRDFNIPRLFAEVLQAEGMLSDIPIWNLATRLEKGQAEDNCPACGDPHNAQAFRCKCGHVLSALNAYKAGAVEYGHICFDTMTSDEWGEADEIKAERDEIKAKREQAAHKPAKGPKAKPETPDKDK